MGDLKSSLVQYRKGQLINVYASKHNLIASLKKLQFFNFLKEELGVLPEKVEMNQGTDLEAKRGWERMNLAYLLVSMTQMQISKAFEFLGNPTFLYEEVISEFSCHRDLSYYTLILLMTVSDYNEFKRYLRLPNVRKVAFFTKEGKNLINCIVKNDFKEARRIILDVLEYLKYDPYMSENLPSFTRSITTSFIKLVSLPPNSKF